MSQSNDRIDILVVEDNQYNMELFVSVLDSTGYSFVTAVDGSEAIVLAEQKTPRLVLLDIQLPGMDGVEVMQHLRQMKGLEDTVIIAVTAYAMKGDRDQFVSQGFDDYMAKPIRIKDMLSLIETRIGKK